MPKPDAPQRNSCGAATIHAFMQFMPSGNSLKSGRISFTHRFPDTKRIEKREEKRCRQSRRIKINRADDIRPYGQYITFSYSIVGGGASTPRKNFPLSSFIFQLSIVNCQLKTVRPKELSLRAAKAAWQSVTPAAIGGAVLRTARKRIPTSPTAPRNDKGRHCAARNYFNLSAMPTP